MLKQYNMDVGKPIFETKTCEDESSALDKPSLLHNLLNGVNERRTEISPSKIIKITEETNGGEVVLTKESEEGYLFQSMQNR